MLLGGIYSSLGWRSAQQLEPRIPWLMQQTRVKAFDLPSADYIWPHVMKEKVRDPVTDKSGEILRPMARRSSALVLHSAIAHNAKHEARGTAHLGELLERCLEAPGNPSTRHGAALSASHFVPSTLDPNSHASRMVCGRSGTGGCCFRSLGVVRRAKPRRNHLSSMAHRRHILKWSVHHVSRAR